MKGEEQNSKVYFEKQDRISWLCGLHAVNNLLGKEEFKKNDFRGICKNLQQKTGQSYSHPIFGGDYDVTVLVVALQQKNLQVEWHNNRQTFNLDKNQKDSNKQLVGYLINLKRPEELYHKILRLSSRHWISAKLSEANVSKNQTIYKLDSRESSVVQMNKKKFLNFIEQQIKKGGTVLKVYRLKESK